MACAGYVNGSPLARAYPDAKAGSFMHPFGANRAYDYISYARSLAAVETAPRSRLASRPCDWFLDA
jgi:hypothetical protein